MKTSALGLLVSLFCLTAPAFSQTTVLLTGIVIDDRTERPIRGVVVYVENQPVLAETGADGRFTLTLSPGRHTVAASVIGYAFLRADVELTNAPLDMTIRLSEGAGAYTERVTVSGTLRGESESVPGSTFLHGRELENLRGAILDDPLRAIQTLPSATATDDFYSEFAVRGNPFRYIGLVVDGVPTRYLMHTAVNGITDGGSIAMINSEILGSVSLLPGSYPQRTGRRLGAEVNMATREGNRDGFRGRAGLSGTSATFLGEGPIANRGSWLVSVRRSYLDYLIKRIDPDADFAFGFVDAQTRATYDLSPRHQVTATLLFGRATFEEGEPDLDDNDVGSAVSRAWLASLSWRYTAGPRFSATNRVYSTGLHFDNKNRPGVTLDTARFVDLGWRVDATFVPAARLTVDFGGDAQRLDGRSLLSRELSNTSGQVVLNRYDENAAAGSAYAQVRIALASRLTVTPGARVDRWGLTNSTTASPWINAELRVGERTRLRGGSGLYRQFADLDQVHGIRGGGDGLRPERALHVDAGVEHTLPHDTRLLFNVYARRERNVLWTPGSEPRLSSTGAIRPGFADAPWVNALHGAARGIELVARRDTPDGFSGWAGYAYGRLRYDDRTTGESFWADADQRHTLSLYGNYRLSSRSSMSVKYRYGSNYPLIGYIGEPPPGAGSVPMIDGQPLFFGLARERNTRRLPAYSRLDVRADRAFTWSSRRLVLFVEVANVLNRTNVRSVPYGVDRFGRVFDSMQSLMPIVPSGGFVIEF